MEDPSLKQDTLDKKQPLDWVILFALSFVWGFSFFFIKKGLEVFTPYQVGSLRIFMSFLAFLPFLFLRKWEIPWSKLKYIITIGLLGSGFPPFLFALAQQHMSSSVAGILNSTTPLFALFLGVLFFGVAFNTKKITGVLLGLFGSVIIAILTGDGKFNFHFGYSLFVILATFSYGLSANVLKKYGQDIHPLLISLLGFCFTGPIAGIYLFSTDFMEVMKTNPVAMESLGYMAILSVFGTAAALFFFNTLVMRTNALFATTTTFLIPIVAVIVGVLDGEKLGIVHLAGLGMILVGVYTTSRSDA